MMRNLLLLVVIATAGCGPSLKGRGEPKLPAARPEAVDALKDAARSVRLGPSNYERALERLKQAHELDPNLWEAYYDEGWLLVKLHRADEALSPLEKAMVIVPANVAVAQTLGEAYLEASRPADAARVYRNWLERPAAKDSDQAVRIRVALGAALRRAGKLDEAIEVLRQALRTAGKAEMPPALNQLALVYMSRNQLELADLVLHRALDADEKEKGAAAQLAATYNNLGLVALRRRRDQEAFAHFDQAAKLDPASTVAKRNKAVVYLDCGDYARAAEELKQVTRSDPSDIDAWVALGVAERGRGNLEAAARAYDKALDLDADTPDALYDLAVLYMDFEKKPGRARERLEQFLKAAPSAHPKKADAEARLKELAGKAAAGAQSK